MMDTDVWPFHGIFSTKSFKASLTKSRRFLPPGSTWSMEFDSSTISTRLTELDVDVVTHVCVRVDVRSCVRPSGMVSTTRRSPAVRSV